jgi:hypothetical protein
VTLTIAVTPSRYAHHEPKKEAFVDDSDMPVGTQEAPHFNGAEKGADPVIEAQGTAPADAPPPAAEAVPPSKQAAVKKRAPRKAPATRAGAKKSAKKAVAAKKAAPRADFPRHSVEAALRIPQALYNQGATKGATVAEAAQYTTGGKVSGAFNVEVSSAKKYGFLRSEAGKLVLEERARKAVAPQTETDRVTALREAVQDAPEISAVYAEYRGENLPDDQFFRNALTDKFHIPSDKVAEFIEVFVDSMRAADLLDESGDRRRLVDLGRDESHRAGKVAGAKVTVAAGTTCFVMQPFGGHLGTYYETVYRPAITQAGLQPVRADDDMFATGKIMDQVWRGIDAAKVLVAELTSKNPNVFYELGLAHALRKPVVLVSSNEEDVPFDLRHIRVIVYDQQDPFWGQKLIDKIAENIKSALTNPEDAIFKFAGS